MSYKPEELHMLVIPQHERRTRDYWAAPKRRDSDKKRAKAPKSIDYVSPRELELYALIDEHIARLLVERGAQEQLRGVPYSGK